MNDPLVKFLSLALKFFVIIQMINNPGVFLVIRPMNPSHSLIRFHFFFNQICRWVAAQSVFYHLYNQVSYMSLDQISPLTFSVGNTMKRISVIVSSIIIFRTPVQPVNALGAAIAILGTFLYSQVKTTLY